MSNYWWCPRCRSEVDATYEELCASCGCGIVSIDASAATPERVKELVEADADGRVLVLPCKAGDRVQINHVTNIGGYIGNGKVGLFYRNTLAPYDFMSINCNDGRIVMMDE